MNRSHKFSIRVASKVATRVLTTIYNFIFSLLIPRALGPTTFGLFELFNSNINQVISLINSGASGAFYTKISQRPNDIGLIRFYFKVIILIVVLVFIILIITLSFFNLNAILDNNNSVKYLILAVFFGLGLFILNTLTDTADAYGITFKNEVIIIIIKGIGVLIVVSLFFLNSLTIYTLYYKEIFVTVLIITGSFVLIKNYWAKNTIKPYLRSTNRQLLYEFWEYCHPLIIATLFSSAGVIFERWILQAVSGSAQQGYFSLALRISSIEMMLGSALSTLLIREVAISFAKHDLSRIKVLMEKALKSMYLVVAFLSAFIFCFSKEIIMIIGGKEYGGGIISMQILAFYPLHQIYGQYTSAFFMGSGKTKLYRNIGIFSTVLGLVTTWILIAPSNLLGFDLKSLGLSIKMVSINIIFTNVNLYFVLRQLKGSMFNFIFHQIGVVFIFIMIVFISKYFIDYLLLKPFYKMGITGLVYSTISLVLILKLPFLMGVSKTELKMYLKKFSFGRFISRFL